MISRVEPSRAETGERWGSWLTRPVRRWLERREHADTLNRCGGDQRCPWCRRWMAQLIGTAVAPFPGQDGLDEFTCGGCGGSSLWRWEIGFFFVCAGDPPPGGDDTSTYGEGAFITEVRHRVRAQLAARAPQGPARDGSSPQNPSDSPMNELSPENRGLVQQREDDDCTICAIAMATGLPYERVMAQARASVGGYRYQGKPGTMSVIGVLQDLGFDAKRTPLAGVPGNVWKRLLWKRPAVLSVPSLNGFDGHHDVLWDGEAIRDPGRKATYEPDATVDPIWAVVFARAEVRSQPEGPTSYYPDGSPMDLEALEDELDNAARQEARSQPGEGWRPIESAPKDGTWFTALQNGETYPCEWRKEEPDEGPGHEGWWDHFNQSFEEPTHWLPSPTGGERGSIVPEPSNAQAGQGWRPIESAPPYRVPVLLIAEYPTGSGWTDIYHGWRNAGGANWDRWPHNFRPTHWMPLPSPPTSQEEGR